MSLPRFYVSPLLDSGELPDDQAHHARDVLRLDHGQSVILFDGCGQYAPANISIEKKHLFYRLTGPITVEAPPAYSLTIATAIPKADRAHQLLEQISQLGAAGLLWLDCRYSVVHPIADAKKMEKWSRLAVESAKQCGRSRILAIEVPRTPRQLLDSADAGTIIWTQVDAKLDLAQRLARWQSERAATPMDPAYSRITVMIGPEGGWSVEEQELLGRHTAPVSLGNNILRIETAAASVAAITQSVLGKVENQRG
ncbi:MAG: RsmE family RNA methyltransferase [Phycisphaerae bacterium]